MTHQLQWKKIVKELLPPLVLRLLHPSKRIEFVGDFPSWQAAQNGCSGYDQPEILEKVTAATDAVLKGTAVFERDSVLFDKPDYNWPLLAILQKIALRNGNRLRIIDFGGSLGSTYRQCRNFLSELNEVEWHVIEQDAFVARGRERFQTGELKFHSNISECLSLSKVPCLLLSSVLQYLEDPYGFLIQVVEMGFECIVVDRTPLIISGHDRIVKQIVPPEIYPASYPARLFNRKKLIASLSDQYDLLTEFNALDKFDTRVEFKGFFFVKRHR